MGQPQGPSRASHCSPSPQANWPPGTINGGTRFWPRAWSRSLAGMEPKVFRLFVLFFVVTLANEIQLVSAVHNLRFLKSFQRNDSF